MQQGKAGSASAGCSPSRVVSVSGIMPFRPNLTAEQLDRRHQMMRHLVG